MTEISDAVIDSFHSQGEDLQALFRQLKSGTQSHAYLISGEKGTGKRTLAGIIAAMLLCSSGGKRPCGKCKNCTLCESGEHPDVIKVEQGNPISPDAKKNRTTIPVEDIREVIRLCGIRSAEGNFRVILIFDADKMTPQAQNCLLKTLEEPPSGTCMILVTERMESLLPTIISRCSTIRMKAWKDDYILSVLAQHGITGKKAGEAVSEANGSIGRALELATDESYWAMREEVLSCFFRTTAGSDVLKISSQWKDRKQDAERMLSILEAYTRLLGEARYDKGKQTDLSFFPPQWIRFSAGAGKEQMIHLIDAVTEARKQLQFSTNFQAVLEKLIFTYMGEGNKWQA